MKINHVMTYMDVAKIFASASKAERRKVGAVLVNQGRIISNGLNGMPPGFDNCCEENGVTRPEVVHAEIDAFNKVDHARTIDAIMFVTCCPCKDCATFISHETFTKEVFFAEFYRNADGLKVLLEECVRCYFVSDGNVYRVMYESEHSTSETPHFTLLKDGSFFSVGLDGVVSPHISYE